MLTLFDDVFSPYARKVRIALYEKGVPFERVRALHGDCNRTDFVHVNPRAEVPALVDGDFSLFDSTVICEYLEDRFPTPPLYPRDPQRRAACRLLEDLADTRFDAATYAVAIVELGRREQHSAMHDAAGRDLAEPLRRAGAPLGDAPFFCEVLGRRHRASRRTSWRRCSSDSRRTGSRHSRLMRWMARVQERPAVVQDNADVMETLQRLQAQQQPAFDPYRVQWRSDRLEWVIKNGFTEWFIDELRAGRAFFPLVTA